ncbi:MAG: di/tricarboxylate transporter, partial [Kangiellaceae bacterium]
FGASNYKFSDFVKIGVPISITFGAIVLALLNWMYL